MALPKLINYLLEPVRWFWSPPHGMVQVLVVKEGIGIFCHRESLVQPLPAG